MTQERIPNRLVKEEVLKWPDMLAHEHDMNAIEFFFGDKEIGHLHDDGTLHILFPRAFREGLLAEGLAGKHKWASSGISFYVGTKRDVKHAKWLLKLSYLRFALKKADNAAELLERESREMPLPPHFQSLLKPFLRMVTPHEHAK
jgi:Luciferase